MTIRHRNMLQAAGFLRTKVEPVLVSPSWLHQVVAGSELTYIQLWRPYELRGEDEDKIARQRQEAKETIAKEESEFEERWHKREQEDQNMQSENGKGPEESNEPSNERQAETSQDTDKDTSKQSYTEAKEAGNGGQGEQATEKAEQSTDAAHNLSRDDEGEEVMEEDKEDMVLY